MSSNEEELKYFVPEIEDIHVGYECEVFFKKGISQTYFSGEDGWEKQTIDFTQISIIPYYIDASNVRVPYLTKEQIEKEGWIYKDKMVGDENEENFEISFDKEFSGGFFKIYVNQNHFLTISQWLSVGGTQTRYRGYCKDINTFRKIMKLLGI